MISLSTEPCPIEGLYRIQRENFEDARGLFSRLYSSAELAAAGFGDAPAQINYSRTFKPGTVRGMHFQHPPFAEAKIVTCLYGEVMDVVIDLRAGSKTFLKWHGAKLSARSLNSLLIPPGLAHGFQVLSDEAHLLYFHSVPYEASAEGRVHPLDPAIKIDWPMGLQNLSESDRNTEFLKQDFTGLNLGTT
jgi:dTDP-4-dehydrorhamnose 3,5-epimerase